MIGNSKFNGFRRSGWGRKGYAVHFDSKHNKDTGFGKGNHMPRGEDRVICWNHNGNPPHLKS